MQDSRVRYMLEIRKSKLTQDIQARRTKHLVLKASGGKEVVAGGERGEGCTLQDLEVAIEESAGRKAPDLADWLHMLAAKISSEEDKLKEWEVDYFFKSKLVGILLQILSDEISVHSLRVQIDLLK